MRAFRIFTYLLTFLTVTFIGTLGLLFVGQKFGEDVKCSIRKALKTKVQCTLTKVQRANSFIYYVKEVEAPKYTISTAGVYFDKETDEITVYTQKGPILKKASQGNIVIPKDMILLQDERSSKLVKSVFKFQGKVFALAFAQTKDCYYASIFNVENGKEYYRFKCIEPKNQTEPYGVGGGTVIYDDHVILALGEPSAESETISLLAQNDNFFYGKILRLDLEGESFKPTILSKGFRNPQGLREIDGKIYSTEHGPHGGDELNHVQFGKNYGWPLHSLGVRYNGGKRFPTWGDETFVNPIYSFLPSVGLSDLRACPKVLKEYYEDFTCILMSSLRGESLHIALLDIKTKALISLEQLPIGTRVREFALGEDPSDDTILVASDLAGLLEIKFLNFR